MKQFMCRTRKTADQGLLGSIEGPAEFEDLMLILLLIALLCFFLTGLDRLDEGQSW